MGFSLKKVVLGLIVILIIVGAALFVIVPSRSKRLVSVPEPAKTESSDSVSIQSVEADTPAVETSSVNTPDGALTLIMEKTSLVNGSSEYAFFTLDNATQEKNEVFKKTILPGESIEVSSNAWSPDNKYFFIKEKTSSSTDYFVFKARGEQFADEKNYIDVRPLFVAKNTGYSLMDITGWDSPTLLHLFSEKESGQDGPSFWFEVPSNAIIPLASR